MSLTSGTATATGGSAPQSIGVIVASMASVALFATILGKLGLPPELSVTLAASAAALPAAISLKLADRRRGRDRRMAEVAGGRFQRPPAFVVLAGAGLIAGIELALNFFVGFMLGAALAVASTNGLLPVTESDVERFIMSQDFTGMVVLLSMLPLLVLTGLVGCWMAHRLERRIGLWVVLAVVVSQALQALAEIVMRAAGVFADFPVNWSVYVLFVALLSVPALLGWAWSRRSRSTFLASRLFRELTVEDQHAAMELLGNAVVSTGQSAAPPAGTAFVPPRASDRAT